MEENDPHPKPTEWNQNVHSIPFCLKTAKNSSGILSMLKKHKISPVYDQDLKYRPDKSEF